MSSCSRLQALLLASVVGSVLPQMYDSSSNLDLPREGQSNGCGKSWEWQCKSGDCLPKYDVCNGIPQCLDGSDEWNCEGVKQLRLNKVKGTTMASTTTTLPQLAYVSITKTQFVFIAVMISGLLACLICFLRRKAKARALSRNRRGNISQTMFSNESDEDDILISSMYS